MENEILQPNKMEKHVTIVAALQVGFSLLGLLFAVVVYSVLMGVDNFVDDPEVHNILPIIATWVPLFFFIISIPGLIGGIGLFMKRNWARYLVIIISVLDLLNIPIGTAVAIYSIWVLVQVDTVRIFSLDTPAGSNSTVEFYPA